MKYRKIDSKYIIRIDKNEEIVASIEKVCIENKIQLGKITAIGAVNKVIIGLFKPEDRKYLSSELKGDFEITSLIGNITSKDNKPYLHIHINIADEKHRIFGGHLNLAMVSATCEVLVEEFAGNVERNFDEDIGLNLLKL